MQRTSVPRPLLLTGAFGLLVALACGGGTSSEPQPLPADPPPPRKTAGEAPGHGAVRDLNDDVAGTFGILTSSANGAFGVAAAETETLRLKADGQVAGTIPVGTPDAATVGPNGEIAVAKDGTVQVFDGRGEALARVSAPAIDVALSPDGATLAIATEDDIRLVDARSGDEKRRLEPDYGGGLLVWHPAGHTLLSSDAFHGYAWDVETGQERARFGSGLFEAMDFAPDGSAVWTWSGTDAPTRWDTATWQKTRPLSNSELVYDGEAHADGEHLRLDTTLAPVDGSPRFGIGSVVSDFYAAFTPDHGGMLLASPTELQRWRFLPAGVVKSLGERRKRGRPSMEGDVVGALVWAPGGGLAEVRSDGEISLWYPVAGTRTWSVEVPCGDEELPKADRDCTVYGAGIHAGRLWVMFLDHATELDLADGAVKNAWPLEDSPMGRLPDGRWVVQRDGLVIGKTPGAGRTVTLPDDAYSPQILGDGFIASVGESAVRRYDARGQSESGFIETDASLASYAMTPDGTQLVEFSSDGTVVRNAFTGEVVRSVPGYGGAIDPSGRWLVSGLHGLVLVELSGPVQREVSPPGSGGYGAYAFSPDGKWLAMRDWDDDLGDQVWLVDLEAVAR